MGLMALLEGIMTELVVFAASSRERGIEDGRCEGELVSF